MYRFKSGEFHQPGGLRKETSAAHTSAGDEMRAIPLATSGMLFYRAAFIAVQHIHVDTIVHAVHALEIYRS